MWLVEEERHRVQGVPYRKKNYCIVMLLAAHSLCDTGARLSMNREDLELDSQVELFQPREAGLSQEQTHSPVSVPLTTLQLHYQVAMSEPETHLFEVSLRIKGLQRDTTPLLDLKMPVWTPGSYLVREYARHLQEFGAFAGDRTPTPLPWRKISKNHWQIDPQGQESVTVRYRMYADELSVRTNHLDGTHGYFNGAALFFYDYDRAS
jgi:hypothetical protein